MGVVPGDPRRRNVRPTDLDRARTIELLRAHFAEGRLSSGRLDEQMARAYAAGSLAELDGLVSQYEGNVRLNADVLLAHGLSTPGGKRQRSFLERQLIYTGIFLAFWIAVWAVTGAGLIWLMLIVVMAAIGFTIRLARGDRGRSGLFGSSSRRSLSR